MGHQRWQRSDILIKLIAELSAADMDLIWHWFIPSFSWFSMIIASSSTEPCTWTLDFMSVNRFCRQRCSNLEKVSAKLLNVWMMKMTYGVSRFIAIHFCWSSSLALDDFICSNTLGSNRYKRFFLMMLHWTKVITHMPYSIHQSATRLQCEPPCISNSFHVLFCNELFTIMKSLYLIRLGMGIAWLLLAWSSLFQKGWTYHIIIVRDGLGDRYNWMTKDGHLKA